MSQEVLNNPDNIGIAHAVSAWFQQDYTGNWIELGDLFVDGVSLAPEFAEHQSYRNGQRAVRKRLLTNKAGTISMTLNEPSMLNLRRITFGGAVDTDVDNVVVHDGRLMKIKDGGSMGLYVDFDENGETAFSSITLAGVFLQPDFMFATDITASDTDTAPNTQGQLFLGSMAGVAADQEIYVRYDIDTDNMASTEIFGAQMATVEGAFQLQVRNTNGGVQQIWDLTSVHLAPNGDISYPLDAIQGLPVIATMQERAGSFGTLYTK